MENLFLTALKKKFRFNAIVNGQPRALNMEQLFELGESELDALYRTLEDSVDGSRGLTGKKGNTDTKVKMRVVEAVYNEVRSDAEEAIVSKDNKEMREALLKVAHTRKFEELTEGKTAEEIIKMAKKL